MLFSLLLKLSNFSLIANIILAFNALLFGFLLFKINQSNKIFTIYLVVILIGEIISKVMIYNGYQNIVMSHYYFIAQFILLSLFFLQLSKTKLQKSIIRGFLLIIPVLLLMQYILFPELLYKFNVFEVFITSFTLISYAIFHFYNMLNAKKEYYYINSGILIYLFGSSIIFLSGNIVIMVPSKFNLGLAVYYINVGLYIVYQLLISYEGIKLVQLKSKKI